MREVLQGDRVLPLPDQEQLDAYFSLQPAQLTASGAIIDTDSNASVAGKYEVIMVNKGAKDGIHTGDVLAILRPGVEVTGKSAEKLAYKLISTEGQKLMDSNVQLLPEEQVGQAMAFKVYDRVSLLLILKASDTVRVGFLVGNP